MALLNNMPPPPKWFQEYPIKEVELKVSQLEHSVNEQSQQIRETIGHSHDDIISLIDRIESVRNLTTKQEQRVHNFLLTPLPSVSSIKLPHTFNETDLNEMISNELSLLAQHNILCKKFSVAAQSLYLADHLNIKSTQLNAQNQILENKLHEWMQNGSSVNSDVFYACLVFYKLNSSDFFRKYLEVKRSFLLTQMQSLKSSIEVFRTVDQTVFVYNRIYTDLSATKLSKSKLIDKIGQRFVYQLLQFKPEASSVRVFPEECYATVPATDTHALNISTFLESIFSTLNIELTNLIDSIDSLQSLINLGVQYVKEAQKSLHASDTMTQILVTCASPFSKKFMQLVQQILNAKWTECTFTEAQKWIQRVSETNREIENLKWFTENTLTLSKQFSSDLQALQSQAHKKWQQLVLEIYTQQRETCLAKTNESQTLDETVDLVKTIQLLDTQMQLLLNKEVQPATELFNKMANQLLEIWTQQQPAGVDDCGYTHENEDENVDNKDEKEGARRCHTNTDGEGGLSTQGGEVETQNKVDSEGNSNSTDNSNGVGSADGTDGTDGNSTGVDGSAQHTPVDRTPVDWFSFLTVLDTKLDREFWSEDLLTVIRQAIKIENVKPEMKLLFEPLV